MEFNFEALCKKCDGLTSGQIIVEIQSKLIELEGRRKANEKQAPFPDKKLARQYQSDIAKLETLKQFMAGDLSDEGNLTENERHLFREIVTNTKQPAN